MTKPLFFLHSILWGAPVLLLILGTGIWLTFRSGFAQFQLLPHGLVRFFREMLPHKAGKGDASSFRALCTALAATVGTGNLVGVAGGICLGGPGAVFWMWVCGFLGMIIKCAEVTLALRYRHQENGVYFGGPMYIIANGLGRRWYWLAVVYACLALGASFGVGNAAQINSAVQALGSLFPGEPGLRQELGWGLLLSVLTGAVLLGGAKRVGSAAQALVIAASAGYLLLCAGALILNHDAIGGAFQAIIKGAFSPGGITGGIITAPFLALRTGCARGLFSNEAGMGTASIAHACASARHPVQQGLMGIVEVFLDTHVICTLTALVILTSGVTVPYGTDPGGELTEAAFCAVYGRRGSFAVDLAMCCFAFATVIGWGLYGGRCAQFLFGSRGWCWFALAQTLAVIPGAIMDNGTVWIVCEILNSLMVIPNLLALAVLTPEFLRLLKQYTLESGHTSAGGGNYANFYQC